MSIVYGRPVKKLQQEITSQEFTELLAFGNRNTLAPDQWWSNAGAASLIYAGYTGQWIDPAFLVPGQVDPDELKARKEEAAEKAMDRKAKNGRDR